MISKYLTFLMLQPLKVGYLALHTSEIDEVYGNDYQRKPIQSDMVFLNLPTARITHGAIWSELKGGELLLSVPLQVPITVQDGEGIYLKENDIVFDVSEKINT